MRSNDTDVSIQVTCQSLASSCSGPSAAHLSSCAVLVTDSYLVSSSPRSFFTRRRSGPDLAAEASLATATAVVATVLAREVDRTRELAVVATEPAREVDHGIAWTL